MKHNSGSITSTDIFFAFLIILVVCMFAIVIMGGVDASIKKKEFYSANGYVEVKYKGMDIWIKKSDIELISPNQTTEK